MILKPKVNAKLTMAINFMYSKDSIETRTLHSKSHNIKNFG